VHHLRHAAFRARSPGDQVGLALFNDRITRAAFSRGLPLIDLRLICNEEGDYANPIEPSVQGGAKIAAAITTLVTGRNEAALSQVIAASELR
jgi:hypothetical protein